MAIINVGFGLSILVACIIVSMPLIQGRSLRRRHGHRSHSDYYNLEESLPRDLSGRLEDDLGYYRDSYGQTKRRGHPQALDRSSEYDDSEDRVPSSFRHYRHEYDSRGRLSLRRKEDPLYKQDDFDALSMGFVARKKRHNRHDSLIYQRNNEQGKKKPSLYDNESEISSKSPAGGNNNSLLELEVKEAQNISMCKYTVESIPDTRGSRVPKDLEHVRCNHIGSSCRGAYCCIQTYRNIEVSYGNDEKETMKLYVGCVCAHQVVNNVEESQLAIND